MINEQYKYSALTSRIIGCAMTVHQTLGNGFQELIYQCALELEMDAEGIPFEREFEMPIFYRSRQIGTRRVDFLVAPGGLGGAKSTNESGSSTYGASY